MNSPADYDAWYQTAKGRWIGLQEFSTILKLFSPQQGQSLLDIGCGTGYFSQHFQQAGLQVTGLDSESAMIEFARETESQLEYIKGDAEALPFACNEFDYCAAITSLCFVSDPQQAITEMWRVSRKAVILGLLNRYSVLYYMKRNSKGYQGARWDTLDNVRQWSSKLTPAATLTFRSVIWLTAGGQISHMVENMASDRTAYAGFLAVVLKK